MFSQHWSCHCRKPRFIPTSMQVYERKLEKPIRTFNTFPWAKHSTENFLALIAVSTGSSMHTKTMKTFTTAWISVFWMNTEYADPNYTSLVDKRVQIPLFYSLGQSMTHMVQVFGQGLILQLGSWFNCVMNRRQLQMLLWFSNPNGQFNNSTSNFDQWPCIGLWQKEGTISQLSI